MEPADVPPQCEACGATEGIHRSHHFGWLCDNVRACMDRVGGPAWVGPDSDIPEHPTHELAAVGECEWCMSHCIHCGSSTWPHDESEPGDYEALGYPETEVVEAICGVDGLAMGIDVYLGTMVGDAWERAVRWRDIQKDIRSDTDSG